MSPLSAIATELRQRHLPHWPSRSRSSRASAALFPTFTSFVKVGSTGRGEAPARAPDALGGRAGGASSFSPCSGRGTQKLPPKEVRVRAAPLHLFQILEGGIREGRSEARARARCARWAGGGAGSDARLPLRETRARPRAPERLVCEGVGCGAGCGTRCGAPAPPRPREGTRRSLVAAPAVAQYPGGGRHEPLLAPSRAPGAARRRRSTSHRSPAPTAHPLPSRSRLSATTNQARGRNGNH